jgi:uncharacterized protein
MFAVRGKVIWPIAVPMAIAQLLGGAIGARLAIRRGAALVRVMVLTVSTGLVIKVGYDVISGW